MEIHQIRYFVAAADEGSVSRAAEKLYISQPALSRQIAALEGEIGIPLFDRIKKRIYLTDAGRFFLPRARQILCDLETNVQKLREIYGQSQQSLRIGFITPFLDDIISPSIKAIRKIHKDLEVALFELLPQAQLDRLREGNLDIAILGNLSEKDHSEFAVQKLAKAKMAVVFPGEHALSKRKQVNLSELQNENFVSLSNDLFPGRRSFLTRICRSKGFEPRITEECDSIGLLLSEVANDGGIALLPNHTSKLPHSGCVFVKLKNPVVYAEVYAVTLNSQMSQIQKSFIDQLKNVTIKVMDT